MPPLTWLPSISALKPLELPLKMPSLKRLASISPLKLSELQELPLELQELPLELPLEVLSLKWLPSISPLKLSDMQQLLSFAP